MREMIITEYTDNIYIYTDAIPQRSQHLLPEVMKFSNPSKEAILYRLLLGTIDIRNKHNDIFVKQRTNYAHIGTKKVNRLGYKSIEDSEIVVYQDIENFNIYFKRNRKNTHIFENLLFEFSNFITQREKGSHISGFVHLYRCIEYISYTFPLIYAAKSNDFKGTYTTLQSFFAEQKSELKFFKIFQKTLFDNSILESPISIRINAPNNDMGEKFKNIIEGICTGFPIEVSETELILNFEHIHDFILTLRNRYFHMLEGDNKRNIKAIDVDMDILFETVNEVVANWISYIYFEITKFGIESL